MSDYQYRVPESDVGGMGYAYLSLEVQGDKLNFSAGDPFEGYMIDLPLGEVPKLIAYLQTIVVEATS